jgi:hydroxylaminobenzene mutase
MRIEDPRRYLFTAGILLFLLALVTGMLMPLLPNMRMGLSAHLVGILGALFLIGLGSLWSYQNLPPRIDKWARGLAVYGTYANLFTGVISAIFSTTRLTPLAGSGHLAAPWQENIVTFGLVSSSVAMVTVCVLVLWGLNRPGSRTG